MTLFINQIYMTLFINQIYTTLFIDKIYVYINKYVNMMPDTNPSSSITYIYFPYRSLRKIF